MRSSWDPREAEAAQLALHGRLGERLRVASRALLGLMNDPEDTHQVFILGMVLNAPMFPRLLARFAMEPGGERLLRERPAIDSEHVDFDALRRLPADTLGGAYLRFLDAKALDADFFQAPPGLPEVPAYVAQRARQVHDLWHVLTGYDTSVPGELALQAFTFGQLRLPSSALIALFGLIRFLPGAPQLPRQVARGFARGRRAEFLLTVLYEDLWEVPLATVREQLRLTPHPQP